jgi:hypothetical protein
MLPNSLDLPIAIFPIPAACAVAPRHPDAPSLPPHSLATQSLFTHSRTTHLQRAPRHAPPTPLGNSPGPPEAPNLRPLARSASSHPPCRRRPKPPAQSRRRSFGHAPHDRDQRPFHPTRSPRPTNQKRPTPRTQRSTASPPRAPRKHRPPPTKKAPRPNGSLRPFPPQQPSSDWTVNFSFRTAPASEELYRKVPPERTGGVLGEKDRSHQGVG